MRDRNTEAKTSANHEVLPNVMKREEAEEEMKAWAEYLELDTEREAFEELVDTLVLVVMKGRLQFDYESDTFTYRLICPIEGQNTVKEVVAIKEGHTSDHSATDRYKKKEQAKQMYAMIARRTDLSVGEVAKLAQRDETRIVMVIAGFFGQMTSSG